MEHLAPAVIIAAAVYILTRIINFYEYSKQLDVIREEEKKRQKRIDDLYGRK